MVFPIDECDRFRDDNCSEEIPDDVVDGTFSISGSENNDGINVAPTELLTLVNWCKFVWLVTMLRFKNAS